MLISPHKMYILFHHHPIDIDKNPFSTINTFAAGEQISLDTAFELFRTYHPRAEFVSLVMTNATGSNLPQLSTGQFPAESFNKPRYDGQPCEVYLIEPLVEVNSSGEYTYYAVHCKIHVGVKSFYFISSLDNKTKYAPDQVKFVLGYI